MVKKYIPERGDVVWIDLDPTKGHEQKGRRPALVVSSAEYNAPSCLVLVVPITSQSKGYPFEIKINTKQVKGVILADQLKSLDWSVRGVTFAVKAPPEVFKQVAELCTRLLNS
jgi:mRNA interferase MazF